MRTAGGIGQILAQKRQLPRFPARSAADLNSSKKALLGHLWFPLGSSPLRLLLCIFVSCFVCIAHVHTASMHNLYAISDSS